MNESLIGKWVEVTLVNDQKWTGYLEEWDEDALFITNGISFGEEGFKGSECASAEVKDVIETDKKEFSITKSKH
jgi:hypothetical protein